MASALSPIDFESRSELQILQPYKQLYQASMGPCISLSHDDGGNAARWPKRSPEHPMLRAAAILGPTDT